MANVTKTNGFPSNEFCALTRVLGMSSINSFGLSSNSINGLIVWIAGPYLVFYDIRVDKQVAFIKNSNNKIISCVTFSSNGLMFATGEGNCKNAEVSIYNIDYNKDTLTESHSLYASYKNHKYGIDKLKFFSNDNYLISVGNKDDKMINIYNLKDKTVIYTNKYGRQIYGFDICDTFMIMSGDSFIKKYNFEKLLENNSLGNAGIQKTYVELGKLKNEIFISSVIYKNITTNEIKIFFLTYQSVLVEMKSNALVLSRWLNVKGERGYSLCLMNNMIVCGSCNGIVRVFNADTLQFVMNLHKPPPLGKGNVESNTDKINLPVQKNEQFADVIAIMYNEYHDKLFCLYSDKSYFIWEIKNTNNLFVYRYNVFHSGAIICLDIDIIPEENLVRVVTGSDDKTVIYWNMRLSDFIDNPKSDKKNLHIAYSRYIRHIFYFGNSLSHFKMTKEVFLNLPKKKEGEDEMESEIASLNSVKFSPDKKFLVVGDNLGNVYVFSLITFENVQTIPACNGIVNAIDMIYDKERDKTYLAAGGSDNVFLVMNVSNGLDKELDLNNADMNFVEYLNSEIVSVIFCIDKHKNVKVITGEIDSTINFFLVMEKNLQNIQKLHESNLKTYCLFYCPSINKVVSGHNGQIKIWKTSTCVVHKHFQVCKSDKLLDNFRIAVDSTGVMFATSNNDKNIRIRALHDGKLLVKIPIAESISSLAFSIDNNYLIATSVEGYVYFYKISNEFVARLKRDNALVNSTDDTKIIQNKLKILKILMKISTSLSKNEQVKYLLQKMEKSEDLTMDDLKIIDSCINENPKEAKEAKSQLKSQLSKETIHLKEEKPNNNDDIENQNNESEDKNVELTKSIAFEKGLKEKNTFGIGKSINVTRRSLADTLSKMKTVNELKKKSMIKSTDVSDKEGNVSERMKIPKIHLINSNKEETNKQNSNRDIKDTVNINEETKPIEEVKEDISPIKEQIEEKKELSPKPKEIKPIQNDKPKQKILLRKDKETKPIPPMIMNTNVTPSPEVSEKQVNEIQEIIQLANHKINTVDDQLKKNEEEEIKKKSLPQLNEIIKEKDTEKVLDINNINLNINQKKNKFTNINQMPSSFMNNHIEEEIKEEIENETTIKDTPIELEGTSFNKFSANIINNSQSQVNQTYMKNMIITQSNFDLCSNFDKNITKPYEVCENESVSVVYHKKEKPQNIISKQKDFSYNNSKTQKEKFNEAMNIDINSIESIDDLKSMETQLESLLDKIRLKTGNKVKDPTMEKILEKYSVLLFDRIDKLSKNK